MEVVRGWSHQPFKISDISCVGEVRRFCAKAVEGWGWSEVDAGRLSLVATELGTNLVRHAQEGELWISIWPESEEIEIIALDSGPGIVDMQRSFQDGFSTGSGSPGTGLGAIRRLASDFDIHSSPQGTLCLVRVRATGKARAAVRRWGAASIAVQGETVCGDGWAVALDGHRLAAVVADGLGHGPHAATAAQAAMDVFMSAPFDPLELLMQHTHTNLQTTRGAALFALRTDAADKLQYTGAGNVLGRLISGVADRSMVTQNGTVGARVRKTELTDLEWPEHSVAVLFTDGIVSRWSAQEVIPLMQRDPTLIAAALLWRLNRGRDDATVLVVKQGSLS